MEEEEAIESRNILKTYFETGDVPTQDQFGSLIDSYVHRTDDNVTIYHAPEGDKRFGIGITTPEAPLGVKATGEEQSIASFNKADEEEEMAAKQIPIDLNASLRQESDESYTIVVEISGIPSIAAANRVSEWLRAAIRENADELGELDTPPRPQ